ncbi:hypothetical protein BSKO_06298 [Bryopsis sp. KO-2023]|nr:hypothetical protein BSKO_06298 [Bryopsis sp. KO-2023]
MDMQSTAPGVWPITMESSPPLADSTNTHIDQAWMKATEAPVCGRGDSTPHSFALSLTQPLRLRHASRLSGSDLATSPGALNMLMQESSALGVRSPLSASLGYTDGFTMPASSFIQQPTPASKPAMLPEVRTPHARSLSDALLLERIAKICRPAGPLETIPVQAMAMMPPEPLCMESLLAQIPVVSNGSSQSLLGYASQGPQLGFGTRASLRRNAAGTADGSTGPRRFSDGIDDSIQSLISVQQISPDCTVVFVTLLVSGFIIGPKGASIREIQKCTGTHIRSYNKDMSPSQPRLVRAFTIQGSDTGQALALNFFKAAIDRYKYLAEGTCRGMRVPHVQNINGIDFFYSPPPKHIVPHAAGLHPLDDSERNLCMRVSKAKKTQEAADRLQAILNTHLK